MKQAHGDQRRFLLSVILIGMNLSFQTLKPGERVIWNGTIEKLKHDQAVKPAPPLAAGPQPRGRMTGVEGFTGTDSAGSWEKKASRSSTRFQQKAAILALRGEECGTPTKMEEKELISDGTIARKTSEIESKTCGRLRERLARWRAGSCAKRMIRRALGAARGWYGGCFSRSFMAETAGRVFSRVSN